MKGELQGRIVAITGASAGIGRALIEACGRAGALIVANARRIEKLNEIEAELKKSDIRILPVAGDASDESVINALFTESQRTFGKIPDSVIVNAGRGLSGSVATSDLSEFEEMVRINLTGAVRLLQTTAQRFSAEMEKSPFPSTTRDIVVLGSTVGRHISPFSAVYGSTKFAVNSLAEALRRELAPKGIRVTLIEPGIVKSEFQEVAKYDDTWVQNFMEKFGPVLEPEDVARAIVFILSQPPHVHINDIVIRPTRQDYP